MKSGKDQNEGCVGSAKAIITEICGACAGDIRIVSRISMDLVGMFKDKTPEAMSGDLGQFLIVAADDAGKLYRVALEVAAALKFRELQSKSVAEQEKRTI